MTYEATSHITDAKLENTSESTKTYSTPVILEPKPTLADTRPLTSDLGGAHLDSTSSPVQVSDCATEGNRLTLCYQGFECIII